MLVCNGIAAGIPEHLLHFASELNPKRLRVRTKHNRVHAADAIYPFGTARRGRHAFPPTKIRLDLAAASAVAIR
jgi:hypothetical protein